MNRILKEAFPDLPDTVSKVIIYYIDMIDREELEAFIKSDRRGALLTIDRLLQETLVVFGDFPLYTITVKAVDHNPTYQRAIVALYVPDHLILEGDIV